MTKIEEGLFQTETFEGMKFSGSEHRHIFLSLVNQLITQTGNEIHWYHAQKKPIASTATRPTENDLKATSELRILVRRYLKQSPELVERLKEKPETALLAGLTELVTPEKIDEWCKPETRIGAFVPIYEAATYFRSQASNNTPTP